MVALFILVISFLPQADKIDSDLLTINGLEFYSSRQQIISALGKPELETSPNYECGFLSSDVQNETFYSLVYPGITFTGNEQDDYLPEKINLLLASELVITYNENRVTRKTSIQQLERILKADLPDHNYEERSYLIYFSDGDDGLIFRFENNLLISIEYWSPC